MVDSTSSKYSSNDISAMASQISYEEREGSYDQEFNLNDVANNSLDYLFNQVLSEDAEVSVREELEAQYGPDRKYIDSSGV